MAPPPFCLESSRQPTGPATPTASLKRPNVQSVNLTAELQSNGIYEAADLKRAAYAKLQQI